MRHLSSPCFGVAGLVAVAALMGPGCGGAGARPAPSDAHSARQARRAEPGASTQPAGKNPTCAKSRRRGRYRVQFLAISSTCPDLEPFEEELAGEAPALPAGCKHDVPDRWSEDECTLERAYTCEQDAGKTSRTVVTSKQKARDGSVLTGIMSVTMIDPDGTSTCQGTYSVLAERSE